MNRSGTKEIRGSEVRDIKRRTKCMKGLDQSPLYAQHRVNCVLNARIEKPPGEHELRGPFKKFASESFSKRNQMQLEFVKKAENLRRKSERAKHLLKSNEDSVDRTGEKIDNIQYDDLSVDRQRSIISQDVLKEMSDTVKLRQRILRSHHAFPETVDSESTNGDSFLRDRLIVLFKIAARRVVLRDRLLRRLEQLKEFTLEE